MTRDDADRILIVVPAIAMWFMPIVGESVSAGFGFGMVGLFVALVISGAFVLVRHSRRARPWLIGTVVGYVLLSGLATLEAPRAVLLLAGSLLMLLGATRLRVPPPARDGPLVPDSPRDDPAATPFAAHRDWRDDPGLGHFAARASRLDVSELAFLAAAWQAGDARTRDHAHRAARDALREQHRQRAFDAVSAEIRAWSQAAVGPWTWEWGAMHDIDRGNRRRAAIPPLLDAAAAIIARDVLAEEDRQALLAPWIAATEGRPQDEVLPEPGTA